MNFSKWQGLGNDFVLVQSNPDQWPPGQAAALARSVCDRHFGVGADGLVLVYRDEQGRIAMRILNPDGSEPEMCGNALRCVAVSVFQGGWVDRRLFSITTRAGVMVPEIILEEGRGDPARSLHGAVTVRVDMGEPALKREQVPVQGTPGTRMIEEEIRVDGNLVRATAISMGNPHCLLFVRDVAGASVHDLGPLLEKHELFPNRINVEFIEVNNDEEITVRVWERGVGETLACGTGACAAVAGSVLTGRTGRRVKVNLPGGRLLIDWADNNHIYMTGPAVEVFRGKLCQDFAIFDLAEGEDL